jgi:hypothetical protein
MDACVLHKHVKVRQYLLGRWWVMAVRVDCPDPDSSSRALYEITRDFTETAKMYGKIIISGGGRNDFVEWHLSFATSQNRWQKCICLMSRRASRRLVWVALRAGRSLCWRISYSSSRGMWLCPTASTYMAAASPIRCARVDGTAVKLT